MNYLTNLFSLTIIALAFTIQINAQTSNQSFVLNDNSKSMVLTGSLDSNNYLNSDTRKKIKIKVNFGRKSKNCRGFGICSLTAELEFDFLSLIFTYGKPDREDLELYITEEGLKNMGNMIVDNNLIIEENYVIDMEQSKKLGFSKEYTITNGTYAIKFDKETGNFKVVL